MIIYTTADVNYFIEHGLEFINSCVSNENKCVVTIFRNFEDDPDEQDARLFKFLADNKKHLHPNAETYLAEPELFLNEMYDCNLVENRGYYTCFRFFHLPKIMRSFPGESVLTLDIDSIIFKKLPEIENYDIGAYLRFDNTVGANEFEKTGMKTLGSIFFLAADQIDVAEKLKNKLLSMEIKWFIDQLALYELVIDCIKDKKRICDFNGTKWQDYEFNNESWIWTGKGNRKFEKRYLEHKKAMKYDGEETSS